MTDPVWRDASVAAAFSETRAARVPQSRTQLDVLLRLMRGHEQCAWLRVLGYVDVDCFWKYFELALFGGVRPAASTRPCS